MKLNCFSTANQIWPSLDSTTVFLARPLVKGTMTLGTRLNAESHGFLTYARWLKLRACTKKYESAIAQPRHVFALVKLTHLSMICLNAKKKHRNLTSGVYPGELEQICERLMCLNHELRQIKARIIDEVQRDAMRTTNFASRCKQRLRKIQARRRDSNHVIVLNCYCNHSLLSVNVFFFHCVNSVMLRWNFPKLLL